MNSCPTCHRTITPELDRGASACPYCAADLPARESPWTSVARVTNLAEAGFLSSDLASRGIENRIVESESFSAVAGCWSIAYTIQAEKSNAKSAADRIRRYQEEADDGYADELGQRSLVAPEQTSEEHVFWRPVALMVIAGVASFVLGQHWALDRIAPQPGNRNTLSTAMEAIGRPFVSEPAFGRPRHRLMFDQRNCTWYLDTDEDGDGRFEVREKYRL